MTGGKRFFATCEPSCKGDHTSKFDISSEDFSATWARLVEAAGDGTILIMHPGQLLSGIERRR
jgi:hypothetical protein